MEWLASITNLLKEMTIQASDLYSWLSQPIFEWNGTQYSALYIATPTVLIIILTYNIIRWLTV